MLCFSLSHTPFCFLSLAPLFLVLSRKFASRFLLPLTHTLHSEHPFTQTNTLYLCRASTQKQHNPRVSAVVDDRWTNPLMAGRVRSARVLCACACVTARSCTLSLSLSVCLCVSGQFGALCARKVQGARLFIALRTGLLAHVHVGRSRGKSYAPRNAGGRRGQHHEHHHHYHYHTPRQCWLSAP